MRERHILVVASLLEGRSTRTSTLGRWPFALSILALVACGREGLMSAGRDSRTALIVPTAARNAVLAEMRTMLGSLNGVLIAQANGDTAAMGRAALASGTAAAADSALERLLPDAWMQLAMSTHQQFNHLAASASRPGGLDSVTVRLARVTGNCVACHAAYRLEARQ